MRVALDAGPLLDPPTGVGRYVGELGSALERRGVDVARFAVALGGRSDPTIARWRLPARVARASWRRFGRPRVDRLVGRADIVHGTNFVLPPFGGGPGVVTVHDLSFLRDDVFPGGERLRELVPWSLTRCARAIVPTAAVAAEVEEVYRFDRARISMTHEGVSEVFFGATPLSDAALGGLGIARPFVIAVGTLEPRKNLARLLAAWTSARQELRDWTLVLAGPRGWGPELPETPGVVLLGWVGDEMLPGLYAAAEVFCYVSLYEGFGLPPLEAMAAGTACLAGRYTAAPEVLGDAAVLVDPRDPDAVGEALVGLAGDDGLRRRMARRGKAHAGAFSWESTAAATTAAYEAALGS